MPLETLLTTVKTKAEEAQPFPNDNKTPLPSGRHRRALTATLQAASQDHPAPPEQGSLAAIHRRPLPVLRTHQCSGYYLLIAGIAAIIAIEVPCARPLIIIPVLSTGLLVAPAQILALALPLPCLTKLPCLTLPYLSLPLLTSPYLALPCLDSYSLLDGTHTRRCSLRSLVRQPALHSVTHTFRTILRTHSPPSQNQTPEPHGPHLPHPGGPCLFDISPAQPSPLLYRRRISAKATRAPWPRTYCSSWVVQLYVRTRLTSSLPPSACQPATHTYHQ
jgi:hypothetical protein